MKMCTVIGAWAFLVVIALSIPIQTHAQDAQSYEGSRAFITPEGRIGYYTVPMIGPDEATQIKRTVETAAKENLGFRDFIIKNPENAVLVGRGNQYFTMSANQVAAKTYKAVPVTVEFGAIQVAGIFGQVFPSIDPVTFLRNLSKDLQEQAKIAACNMPIRPNSFQATASVGVISFSATWDTTNLCQ